jgi:hypothetical protein
MWTGEDGGELCQDCWKVEAFKAMLKHVAFFGAFCVLWIINWFGCLKICFSPRKPPERRRSILSPSTRLLTVPQVYFFGPAPASKYEKN